jgi:L-alanine-DL-glutamate epimerase-like enolase superfamily enzyme
VETHRDVLLLRVETDHGDGWGECVALQEPRYSPEFVDGAQLVIRDHLWPDLTGGGPLIAADVARRLAPFEGHPMARATLEMAVLDTELRATGRTLHDLFGGGRERVPSGVSVGIFYTLDESIVSLQTAADAIELGAAEVVNIKPGRFGGHLEARQIHDLCVDRGVPVWCGGMLETGIGRAANAALAALPGFTLPGDISASTRFSRRDIVRDPITVTDGQVTIPTAPGLGFDLDVVFLDEITTASVTI